MTASKAKFSYFHQVGVFSTVGEKHIEVHAKYGYKDAKRCTRSNHKWCQAV